MTSIIAWLDTSSDEQRRVRELVSLFAQTESRDELGIGQIRDAFSDTLFPGTSVIQTRARYFLFVPWIYKDGTRRGYEGVDLEFWAARRERRLIEALRTADDLEGLIGRRAGPAVKTLPSTIYWSGLTRYGILMSDVAIDRLGVFGSGNSNVEADELATRTVGDWHPTLPLSPAGFPDRVEGGFELTYDEGNWLTERILDAAGGTLLSHLLERRTAPDHGSAAPWEDSACADAPRSVRDQLRHGHLFSLGIHGAALLYNLLLGERYEAEGHSRIPKPVDKYRDLLARWADDCTALTSQFITWDRGAMWDLITSANPRISLGTRAFVDGWLDVVTAGEASTVADNHRLRENVSARERRQKKAQSRLVNERLLRSWSGESGSAPLTFRWPQVRRIVTDIHRGVGKSASA